MGGRFAPLAELGDDIADLDSMVNYFNKAVTATAAEHDRHEDDKRDLARGSVPGSGNMHQKQ